MALALTAMHYAGFMPSLQAGWAYQAMQAAFMALTLASFLPALAMVSSYAISRFYHHITFFKREA
jgi:hypothetical protein